MLQVFSDYPCKSAIQISVLLAEMMINSPRFFAVDFMGMNGIFGDFGPCT
jgi:hypothetical protein